MLYNPRAVETLRFAGLNEENLASQVIHASFLMFFEDHSRFDFEKLSWAWRSILQWFLLPFLNTMTSPATPVAATQLRRTWVNKKAFSIFFTNLNSADILGRIQLATWFALWGLQRKKWNYWKVHIYDNWTWFTCTIHFFMHTCRYLHTVDHYNLISSDSSLLGYSRVPVNEHGWVSKPRCPRPLYRLPTKVNYC